MAKNGTLAKSQELQPSFQTATEQITIGIDLGDRFSHCCVLGKRTRTETLLWPTDSEILFESTERGLTWYPILR
jgi:hypothetical protein